MVQDDTLNCKMYMRAGDMALGVPFNIASYALFLCLLAHVSDLKPGELVIDICDTHIYNSHFDGVAEQLKRTPEPFPILQLNKDIKNLFDFKFEDLTLIGYQPKPAIKLNMFVIEPNRVSSSRQSYMDAVQMYNELTKGSLI